MEIRQYKSDDSGRVKNLILSILKKEYPFDQSAYHDTDIDDISGTYGGKGNVFFVAEKDKHVVGTVGIKRDTAESALVRRLFVDKNHRRMGIGMNLLVKAIDFCRSNNYKEIVFRATDRMVEATKLLKKMGFREKDDLEVSGFHIHRFVLTL